MGEDYSSGSDDGQFDKTRSSLARSQPPRRVSGAAENQKVTMVLLPPLKMIPTESFRSSLMRRTRRLADAATLLQIPLLDHVIVGRPGERQPGLLLVPRGRDDRLGEEQTSPVFGCEVGRDCNLDYNFSMTKLKVRAIGSSYGVILPKEILDALNVAEGDELFAIRTPEGLKLAPYNPDFEKWLDAAKDAVRRYRDDLRALAKS